MDIKAAPVVRAIPVALAGPVGLGVAVLGMAVPVDLVVQEDLVVLAIPADLVALDMVAPAVPVGLEDLEDLEDLGVGVRGLSRRRRAGATRSSR